MARKNAERGKDDGTPGAGGPGQAGGGGPFAPGAETALAMALLTRWFPPLVRRFEAGVQELGLVITRRHMERYEDGTVCPVIDVRCGVQGGTLVLKLRNALDDFLCVDRDARPVRLDLRLVEDAFADGKLAKVVDGRLEIVRAIAEAKTPGELQAKADGLARHFDRFRMTLIDLPDRRG